MTPTKFLAIFSDKILVVSMAFALGSIAADKGLVRQLFYPQHPTLEEAPAPKYLVLLFPTFRIDFGWLLVYVYVI